jgi:hypothetical protein
LSEARKEGGVSNERVATSRRAEPLAFASDPFAVGRLAVEALRGSSSSAPCVAHCVAPKRAPGAALTAPEPIRHAFTQ